MEKGAFIDGSNIVILCKTAAASGANFRAVAAAA